MKKQNDTEEDYSNRDFLKGKDLSKADGDGRPDPPKLRENLDDMIFMQLDCDYYSKGKFKLLIC